MSSSSALQGVTGLILAGGRASRMQQVDKGLQQLNQKSLTAHVIARLEAQVGQLAINANRHLSDYAHFGFPVWPDLGADPAAQDAGDFKGPLAGLETGLTHCSTPYLLTVPCDSPFLPRDLAQRLMTALQLHDADIAVACTGPVDQVRLQPVFCLMSVSMLAQLQSYLQSGGRKMDGWYGKAAVVKVHFRNEAEFRNINTLEELQACAGLQGDQ